MRQEWGSYYDVLLIKYDKDGNVKWATSFGSKESDIVYSISTTKDGGFLAAGYFQETITLEDHTIISAGKIDGMVIKYSNEGKVEWAKNIGGSSSDYIESIAATEDGGYIIGGTFESNSLNCGNGITLTNMGKDDGMLIKYSSQGEAEWAIIVGGTQDDRIKSVVETSDNSYLIGGYFKSTTITIGSYIFENKSNQYSNGMLFKCDSKGKVEYATAIGDSDASEEITSVVEISNGKYIAVGSFKDKIMVGNYELTSTAGYDGMIIEYSTKEKAELFINKANIIGTNKNDEIKGIIKTDDGGYIAVGNTLEGDILKYDKNERIEWKRETQGKINSIIELKNGDYLAVGNTPLGDILRYNLDGTLEWSKATEYTFYSAMETENGDYILGTSTGLINRYDEAGNMKWSKKSEVILIR